MNETQHEGFRGLTCSKEGAGDSEGGRTSSSGVRRRAPALAATLMVSLAMGLVMACSAAHPDTDDNDAPVQDSSATVPKAVFLDGVGACENGQNCEMKEVCVDDIGPCDPPIIVNGRNIHCIVKVCTQQRVCTPCEVERGLEPTLDIPFVDIDDFPFDPSPLSR